MSVADHWMKLYVGDYLADTQHLTTTQHGAYLLLLMHQWRTGSIPDDDAKQARIVGMHHHAWARIKGTILAFFGPADEPGTLRQKRCHEEREKVRDIAAKRAAAARSKTRDPHVYPPSRRARVPPLQTRTSNGGVKNAKPLIGNKTSTAHGHAKLPFCILEPEPEPEEERKSVATLRAAEPPLPPPIPDRDWVWGEGLQIVRGFTGNGQATARRFLGRLVKEAHDDCGRVRAALTRAADELPIDAQAWLMNAVRHSPRDERANYLRDLIEGTEH